MEFLVISIFLLTALGLSLIFLNSIQKNKKESKISKKSSDPWMGLKGMSLWQVMTDRKKIEGINPDYLRNAYEQVLVNHITETFNQGKKDAAQDIYLNPQNEIMVNSPFGLVASWIPLNFSNTIYRCGVTFINQDPDKLPYIHQDLDETCETMLKLVKILRNERMSTVLMPKNNINVHESVDEPHTTSHQDQHTEIEIAIHSNPIHNNTHNLEDK